MTSTLHPPQPPLLTTSFTADTHDLTTRTPCYPSSSTISAAMASLQRQSLMDLLPPINSMIDHNRLPPSLSTISLSSPYANTRPSFLSAVEAEYGLASMPQTPGQYSMVPTTSPPPTVIGVAQYPHVHQDLRSLIDMEHHPLSRERGQLNPKTLLWASKVTHRSPAIEVPEFVTNGAWPCWGTVLMIRDVGAQRFDRKSGKAFYLCMALESVLLPGRRDRLSGQLTMVYHPFATVVRQGDIQALIAVWLPQEWVPLKLRHHWDVKRDSRREDWHKLTVAEDGMLWDREIEVVMERLAAQYAANVGVVAAKWRARMNQIREEKEREQRRITSAHTAPAAEIEVIDLTE